MKKFKELELKDEIVEATEVLGYANLTEVQEKTIPLILEGKDIVVKSQTGSGKTASFGVPICNSVVWDERSPQALVVVPTRELAMQVREEFFNLGRLRRLKITEVYGKSPYRRQENDLRERSHVVVGTPGRIIDHIEKGNLRIEKIKYLVLDEADEMLNMGFLEQVEKIIGFLPEDRQTLLFSATMPSDIENLANEYMKKPEFIKIKSKSNTMDRIRQRKINIGDGDKIQLLKDLTLVENPDNCIIFCNTRDEVDYVYESLRKEKYSVDRIHGGMEQKDRTQVMENFKLNKFRYLVSTDVAARGIDVEDITHVINYDVPRDLEPYVHRIGRTGRKGKKGNSISLYDDYEARYLRDIEDYIGLELEEMEAPEASELSKQHREFWDKMAEKPEEVHVKGEELNEGILKLHINAGKKTKMRAGDLVGAICSIDGITAEDIGIISIIDTSSFVEILNNKGEFVYKELQDKKIKGRERTVSKARQ